MGADDEKKHQEQHKTALRRKRSSNETFGRFGPAGHAITIRVRFHAGSGTTIGKTARLRPHQTKGLLSKPAYAAGILALSTARIRRRSRVE
ncbi:hypothetical protein [Saliniramus sp.]|uniref:hypothetical protein n=1 Tax=Saliniramus sp. TaxID=2986772 RepID=UPI002C56F96C|nr:hypothetical protein [Saliniramus sp.]HMB11643.1 hypothetical protein [Saliniramus sp.]